MPFAGADFRRLDDRFAGVAGPHAHVAQIIEKRVHRNSSPFFDRHFEGLTLDAWLVTSFLFLFPTASLRICRLNSRHVMMANRSPR